MLSRNAKKVLKLAKKNKDQKISYDALKQILAWDYDKIHSACDQLIQQNLVKEKQGLIIPGRAYTSSAWGVVLTEKGRHRWKYIAEDAWMFTFKSVIIPIVVSAITALITAIITVIIME